MSDRFTDQVREALHDTAAAVPPGGGDLDRVRADADRRRPRDGRVVPLAVAAVVLVVLGVVTVQVFDRPAAVVLEDGSPAVAASAETLIGRTFTSTSVLPGAPAPDGVLTVRFTPPQNAEEEGPGRVNMAGDTEPGCNGGSVVAEVDAGGQTHLVTEILSTTGGCLALPIDMDDWWHDLLQAQPQLLLDVDRLVVRTEAGQIDMVDDSTVGGVLPAPPEDSFSPLASVSPSTVEPGDRTIEMHITGADHQLSAGTNFRLQRWDGEEWQWQYHVHPSQGLSPGVGASEGDGYDIQPGETLTEELPLMYLRRGIYRVGLVMQVSGGPTDGSPVDVYARLVVGQPSDNGVPAEEAADDVVEGAVDLSGTSWESVDVAGHTIPEGATIRLEFDGSRFFADIDCNRMAAPYTIDDERLIVVLESTTETTMACPGQRADADRWFLDLVTSQPQVTRDDDTLTITGDGSYVVLELVENGSMDGSDEVSQLPSAGPGTDAASPGADDPDVASGVAHSYSSPVIRMLAAGSTNNETTDGVIVNTSDALADAWSEAEVQGTPPALPDDHVGVFVTAVETRSTCRSPEDVLNVAISGAHAVVRLHPDGEFTRPCPGPTGSHAWTAFVVAIPDELGAGLETADVQLAESASE